MLGLHAPPNGPATPSRFRFLAICFGDTPATKSRKIRSTIRGLFRNDFALARRHGPGVQCLYDAIAVAEAAGRLAVLDAAAESAVCLLREILQEQGVHRALEADVQVRDVALGERDDVDAGEGEALEEAGRVFLVAAEAVQRLGEHDVEPAVERIAHQRLESRAQQRRAGHRVVRVLLADRPALPLGERAAHAELIGDGRIPLVVRGVARVDGNFHDLHLIESLRSLLQFQLEALARGLSRQRSNERTERRVCAVVAAPAVLRPCANPIPPAASRS